MFKFLIILAFCSGIAIAQDERAFEAEFLPRDIFKEERGKEREKYKWIVRSAKYEYDINKDGKYESFEVQKKDGEDWISIFDHNDKPLLNKKLQANGFESYLYKITVHKISPRTRTLVLHFYEGYSDYLKFQATGRLYFISIDNGNLNKMSFYKGPSFFDEKELPQEHYHQRQYDVSAIDMNGDGTREISLKYRDIAKVYFYLGEGHWKSI